MTRSAETFIQQPLESAPTRALRALWLAAHDQWDAAHEEAQVGTDRDSAWVHALLHREEGDTSNAGYWYRRAGRPPYHGSIQQEREAIIGALLHAHADPAYEPGRD